MFTFPLCVGIEAMSQWPGINLVAAGVIDAVQGIINAVGNCILMVIQVCITGPLCYVNAQHFILKMYLNDRYLTGMFIHNNQHVN